MAPDAGDFDVAVMEELLGDAVTHALVARAKPAAAEYDVALSFAEANSLRKELDELREQGSWG